MEYAQKKKQREREIQLLKNTQPILADDNDNNIIIIIIKVIKL